MQQASIKSVYANPTDLTPKHSTHCAVCPVTHGQSIKINHPTVSVQLWGETLFCRLMATTTDRCLYNRADAVCRLRRCSLNAWFTAAQHNPVCRLHAKPQVQVSPNHTCALWLIVLLPIYETQPFCDTT